MLTETAEGWRALLIAISLVNVLAWSAAAALLLLRKGASPSPPEMPSLRRTLLLLSAGYVFGCAFRSFWPVYDIPRVVMVDTWMSSVLVGRSVATVAELCFVMQCALLLRAAGVTAGSRFASGVARLLLPMALVAETCSWYAVLSTSNLGHVFEETLWGLGAGLWTAGLLALWPRSSERTRLLLMLCGVVGVAYFSYMFAIDVPMYWARWLADESAGRAYLDLAQGLADVSSRWTVSTSWHHWRGEVAWMTLYFSVAVWLSIALVHLPLPRPALARGRT